ncbi:MAG: capsular polysaccharide biosynthesis protein [Ruminococcaceae bacterium]|nr:capsular polysaccharide biosynthesis protein [Oscillospiraceae bacterium]
MKLTVDYHCHLLPGIDDGASSPEITKAMLEKLASQGIRLVYATPHFIAHRQSVKSFLKQRDDALRQTLPLLPEGVRLLPAAEVALEQNISETCDLSSLTMGSSRSVLIELPFSARQDWIAHEIDNILYGQGITPVFAHIERYRDIYGKELFAKILATEGAIFQFTTGALRHFSVRRLFKRLCEDGLPILLGSDAHNADKRPPDFDKVSPMLDRLFKKGVPDSFHRLES